MSLLSILLTPLFGAAAKGTFETGLKPNASLSLHFKAMTLTSKICHHQLKFFPLHIRRHGTILVKPLGIWIDTNNVVGCVIEGYYMVADSHLALSGDKVQLMSPMVNITQNTLLAFYYLVSSKVDISAVLHLFRYSRYFYPTALPPFQVTHIQRWSWQRATVCLPSGNYHLVFEVTMGTPFESDVAIDDIALLEESCDIAEPTFNKTGEQRKLTCHLCRNSSLAPR